MGGGGGLDLLNWMTSTAPTTQSGVYGFAALQKQLETKVTSSFARSHETDCVLLENSTLRISYFKVFKEKESMLCLFVSNLSGWPLSDIVITVKMDNSGCPLELEFDVSNSLPRPNLRNANTAVVQGLTAGGTVCQIITFGILNPNQVVMPCNFVVSVHGETIKIPLKINDLMRPSSISTADFGVNWAKLAATSCTVNVNAASASVQRFVNRVSQKMHLHHISTIDTEIIAAGNLSSRTNAKLLLPVLVYCKCTVNARYWVMVRTPSRSISNSIALELQQLLSPGCFFSFC